MYVCAFYIGQKQFFSASKTGQPKNDFSYKSFLLSDGIYEIEFP